MSVSGDGLNDSFFLFLFFFYLASVAGLPEFPATVTPTAPHEGRVATQHDVEDDAEAPQVAALVVNGGLLAERFHHLWRHVLGGTTLRDGESKPIRRCINSD